MNAKNTFIVTTRVITKGAADSIGDSVPVCEETPLGPSAQRGPGECPASTGSSQVLLQVVLKITLFPTCPVVLHALWPRPRYSGPIILRVNPIHLH